MKHLSEIVDAALAKGRKRLAVAYGQDSHTIEAVYDAYKDGLVDATLFGDKTVIEATCAELGIDPATFTIVDEKSDVKCVELAVKAVVAGECQVLMKGMVSTDKYMRGILNKEAGLFPPKGTLSHVSVFEWLGYPKLLLASDIAVLPQPDFKQKLTLVKYLAQTAKLIGVDCPKIACVAAMELVNANMPAMAEGAIISKMADRGQLGNVIVDGPLSLDVALYPEVAEHKKVKGSAVAGDADALLFPNLESGNVFFKSVSHIGGGELAAMVVGTNKPCVLTSRGDSALSKKYSIALACLAAK